MLGVAKGFTRSHRIDIDVRRFGGGDTMANALERANIILNMNLLLYDDPRPFAKVSAGVCITSSMFVAEPMERMSSLSSTMPSDQ